MTKIIQAPYIQVLHNILSSEQNWGILQQRDIKIILLILKVNYCDYLAYFFLASFLYAIFLHSCDILIQIKFTLSIPYKTNSFNYIKCFSRKSHALLCFLLSTLLFLLQKGFPLGLENVSNTVEFLKMNQKREISKEENDFPQICSITHCWLLNRIFLMWFGSLHCIFFESL